LRVETIVRLNPKSGRRSIRRQAAGEMSRGDALQREIERAIQKDAELEE
jgi:hypothetical protein